MHRTSGAWSRRRIVKVGLGAAATLALPLHLARAAAPRAPFPLGIASGFPTSSSVVLWTRIARDPLAPGGGLPPDPVEVRWQMAADEAFARVIASGTAWAIAQHAHSVHVEPGGLEPARDYWYRFEALGQRSPAGRTRTAAAPGAPLASLRAAIVSCQHYEHAEWAAYRHLAANAPDLVLHLGDYIYESSVQRPAGRRHVPSGEAFTLEDYRARYAQYKLDPALQAAHAVAPWITMWDDHEVENDYADDKGEDADPPEHFLQRRAAAHQAYYEHMPVPRRAVPFGSTAHLYCDRVFGNLASITMLDGRQYRSHDACVPAGRGGAIRTTGCPELFDPSRTMLGATQEAWLGDRLKESRARWNVIAQGTPMAYIDQAAGPEKIYWTDSWAGYPAARDRLMAQIQATRVSNPLVLSGDVHAFGWSGLRAKAGRDDGPIVAPEIITSSISSNALAQPVIDEWREGSPELAHIDGTKRGYVELTLSPDRARATLIAVDDAKNPMSPCRAIRSLEIGQGSPEISAN